MKILSIKQPWAWLIVNGHKDVENRTWRTLYRGLVLVHASGKRDRVTSLPIAMNVDVNDDSFNTGGIVGVTEIVDCVEDHRSQWKVPGQFGFVLRNSRTLPFVPCKGQLGIRDVPPALMRKINL